jgi:arginyl-tRNA synthetase
MRLQDLRVCAGPSTWILWKSIERFAVNCAAFITYGSPLKTLIEALLKSALNALPEDLVPAAAREVGIEIESTRDAQHGDFASNLAMRLGKAARQNPRKVAQALVAALPSSDAVDKVEIAGAGFINFFLKGDAYTQEIGKVLEERDSYGRSLVGAGRRVQVEFVSANPTGPLHVAHGRHAAFGASVSNLLEAAGYTVQREYYINDAGRQTDILALSAWLRYLERCGEQFTFPSNAYVGEYLVAVGEKLLAAEGVALRHSAAEVFRELPPDEPQGGDKDVYIDALMMRARALIGEEAFARLLRTSLEGIVGDIREDLAEFGVTFDCWFSERSLSDSGAIDRSIETLSKSGHAYLKDGALWFKSTDFGDEKDRVIVRDNGVKTYFASDIAYVLNKLERGFGHLIYIWGADHHGYIARLRAALIALGGPPERFEVLLMQIVSLFRGGEKAKMSKRSGDYVTLRDLRKEVGNDAARLFYVMRSNDQHLDFDMELAKSKSNENPVYYIQYAHARVASVLRQLKDRGLTHDAGHGMASFGKLTEPQEQQLIKRISAYPELIKQCAAQRAPHSLVHYLRDLANDFHTYYSAHQFIVEDSGTRNARLDLALATQTVIRNGLKLLGVSAPDTM